MNSLWKVLVLTVAALCGGCGDYNRVHQEVLIETLVFDGFGEDARRAVYERVIGAAGGEVYIAGKAIRQGRNDDGAAALLEEVREERTPADKAARAVALQHARAAAILRRV